LDRLRSGRRDTHKDIHWRQLHEVRLAELAAPMSWQANPLTQIEVPPGPVLRIVGAGEKWVLPVTEAMGEDLAAAITLRFDNRR
jgi:hypothetical protein